MLNLFKRKNATELDNIKMIPVPDIRAYMIKGYEEIKEVKEKNKELEQKVQELQQKADKNEKLYEAQLIVSQEFKSRCNRLDKDLDWEKSKREDENAKRQADIELNLKRINKLKEEKYILEEQIENFEKYKEQEIKKAINKYENELCIKIKNVKGRISKDNIINLIKKGE